MNLAVTKGAGLLSSLNHFTILQTENTIAVHCKMGAFFALPFMKVRFAECSLEDAMGCSQTTASECCPFSVKKRLISSMLVLPAAMAVLMSS